MESLHGLEGLGCRGYMADGLVLRGLGLRIAHNRASNWVVRDRKKLEFIGLGYLATPL